MNIYVEGLSFFSDSAYPQEPFPGQDYPQNLPIEGGGRYAAFVLASAAAMVASARAEEEAARFVARFWPVSPQGGAAPQPARPVIPIFVTPHHRIPEPPLAARPQFYPTLPRQQSIFPARPVIPFRIGQWVGEPPALPLVAIPRFYPLVPFYVAPGVAANPVIPFRTVPVTWWHDPEIASYPWDPSERPRFYPLIVWQGTTWAQYEAFLQFDATQYTPGATVLFEVVFRRSVGAGAASVRARVWNITDGSVVPLSPLVTTAASFARLRSAALTLAGAREYRAEMGVDPGTTNEVQAARLIVQQ